MLESPQVLLLDAEPLLDVAPLLPLELVPPLELLVPDFPSSLEQAEKTTTNDATRLTL